MTNPAQDPAETPTANAHPRPVLVVDFGAQYAQLIARRVREARVYSEVVPHTISAAELKEKDPVALVLSGGPSSVYEDGAPQLDPEIFELGLPTFGICYGFQVMTQALGGTVAKTGSREYGRTNMDVRGGVLHSGLNEQHPVWMSHGDSVTKAPDGFDVTAATEGAPVAAFENAESRMAGVQYHPEVMHSPHGQQVLTRFLTEIAGLEQTWTASNIADQLIDAISEQIGPDGHAICGLSGGVDSAVAAALVQRAIGDRLTCVFVDHGLLRKGEREQVETDFVAATGARLVTVDEREAFLCKLAGVTDPEEKRKAIGAEFIRSFERAVADVVSHSASGQQDVGFWCKAPCTRTLSSPAAARVPRTLRATTTSAACLMMLSSSSSSPCAPCSRTRFVLSAASWACRK